MKAPRSVLPTTVMAPSARLLDAAIVERALLLSSSLAADEAAAEASLAAEPAAPVASVKTEPPIDVASPAPEVASVHASPPTDERMVYTPSALANSESARRETVVGWVGRTGDSLNQAGANADRVRVALAPRRASGSSGLADVGAS